MRWRRWRRQRSNKGAPRADRTLHTEIGTSQSLPRRRFLRANLHRRRGDDEHRRHFRKQAAAIGGDTGQRLLNPLERKPGGE